MKYNRSCYLISRDDLIAAKNQAQVLVELLPSFTIQDREFPVLMYYAYTCLISTKSRYHDDMAPKLTRSLLKQAAYMNRIVPKWCAVADKKITDDFSHRQEQLTQRVERRYFRNANHVKNGD